MDMGLKIEDIPDFAEQMLCYDKKDYDRQVFEENIEIARNEGMEK